MIIAAPPDSNVNNVTQNHIEWTFSQKQIAALQILDKPRPDTLFELLYGGAKGGGKSVFGVRWCYLQAKNIIKEFKSFPQSDPKKIPIVGFMGRLRSVDFSATTLEVWKKEIPEAAYQLRTIDGKIPVIVIENRVAIQYGGMDNQESIAKFNSAEFMFYFVDQSEEIPEKQMSTLRGAMRLKMGPLGNRRPPPWGYKGLLTANPAECWLKREFINPRTRSANCDFVKALPTDNPFLAPGYVDTLRRAFAFNPALLRAYLYGEWDNLADAFVMIPRRHVEACVTQGVVNDRPLRKVTVLDVAGESETADESVIGDFTNETLTDMEIYAHRDLMDTLGRTIVHAKKHGSNMIVIDKIGMGAGVWSRAIEVYKSDKTMTIYGFDGRIKPPEGIYADTYVNWKAYAWGRASQELFAERKTKPLPDDELIRQLCGVKFKFSSNGKIQIWPKEDIIEELGCSPDRADMYIMGLDGLRFARPIVKKDGWDAATSERSVYRWTADSV